MASIVRSSPYTLVTPMTQLQIIQIFAVGTERQHLTLLRHVEHAQWCAKSIKTHSADSLCWCNVIVTKKHASQSIILSWRSSRHLSPTTTAFFDAIRTLSFWWFFWGGDGGIRFTFSSLFIIHLSFNDVTRDAQLNLEYHKANWNARWIKLWTNRCSGNVFTHTHAGVQTREFNDKAFFSGI